MASCVNVQGELAPRPQHLDESFSSLRRYHAFAAVSMHFCWKKGVYLAHIGNRQSFILRFPLPQRGAIGFFHRQQPIQELRGRGREKRTTTTSSIGHGIRGYGIGYGHLGRTFSGFSVLLNHPLLLLLAPACFCFLCKAYRGGLGRATMSPFFPNSTRFHHWGSFLQPWFLPMGWLG